MLPPPEELDELCRATVQARAFASSLVVSLRADGADHHLSYGTNLGQPVDVDALCELHCMTKPILAWTLLEVASDHGLDPNAPLAEVEPLLAHLDGSVTVVGICNHLTRIAQPSALDWVTRPPSTRPRVTDLRQEPEGAWYSEVGAWLVAATVISSLTGRPAEHAIEDLIDRCDADAYIGRPLPPDRQVVVPTAGLPGRDNPMLHVEHPTYRARLGPEFGGFGSMPGYARFLRQVGLAIAGKPSALRVAPDVIAAVMTTQRQVGVNQTWRRPARFLGGFADAAGPGEPGGPGQLVMFAGIGGAGCLVDPASDRQIAYCSDAASFDPTDHQFLRRQLIGAFLAGTAGGPR